MLCAKYPQSPSFIPNTKGDSFYLISNRGEGLQPTQIRLSNHGTYLETWCDRNELGDSVERLNPALCVNISIVFVDEGEDLTKDCKGMPNCEGCEIEPCKPQTFEGQDQIGRPFTVIQYVYSSKCIRRKYINGLTKAIAEASTKGKYIDPLADLYRAAKDKEFHSSTKLQNNKGLKPENKQYKRNTNMNKKQVRLTETDLKQIVKESVNKILSEASLSEGDLRVSSSSRVNDVMMKLWADFNAAESRIKTIMHSRRNASPDRNNLNFKNDDEVANAYNCLHDIKTILINTGFNHPQGTYIFKQPTYLP